MNPGDGGEDWTGVTAVVTGGSSGIGRAICLALARRGARLSVCSLSGKQLERLGEDLSSLERSAGEHHLSVCDVTDPERIQQFAENTILRQGAPDLLVACAGTTDREHHRLVDLPVATWRRVIDVNLTGTYFTLRSFLPEIEHRDTNLVVISSLLGQKGHGRAGDGPYCSSKFGVEGLVEVVADEYRNAPLNINTAFPAQRVNTGFFSHLPTEERTGLAEPEVMVKPVLFLGSLPPNTMSGRSVNARRWREEKTYRQQLREEARA